MTMEQEMDHITITNGKFELYYTFHKSVCTFEIPQLNSEMCHLNNSVHLYYSNRCVSGS